MNEDTATSEQFDRSTAIQRLGKDLKVAAATMGVREARYLVDSYYVMQKDRIRFAHQERACREAAEPIQVLDWCSQSAQLLENQIKRALDAYSAASPVGAWMREQMGVGPVLAAGLLANIDIERCPTVGHIWNFAGLNPDIKWEKGNKRPWNADFKTICAFKLGECFVKVCNKEEAFYGRMYAERKKIETAKNEAGEFADQARKALEAKKYGKTTDAYKWYSGAKGGTPMLPPAHIHARARRWAVKLFLSHLHEIWRRHEGLPLPKPFSISVLGHGGYIAPPGGERFPAPVRPAD